MEKFIRVTADQCNADGNKASSPQMPPQEFSLNIDLVAGIMKKQVLLIGGNILHAGDKYFTNINLVDPGKTFHVV